MRLQKALEIPICGCVVRSKRMETRSQQRKRAAEEELFEPTTDLALAKKRIRYDYGEDGEYNNPDCKYPPDYDISRHPDDNTIYYGPPDMKYDEKSGDEVVVPVQADRWLATNGDSCSVGFKFTKPGDEIDISEDRSAQQWIWDRLPLTAAQKIELLKELANASI